mgnify:FL=1
MTYDNREILAAFHTKYALPYPLLQDKDVRHFAAYGVENEHYEPGESGYGIPHPGILFINPEGVVEIKFAAPGFRNRPSFEAIYSAIANE